MKREVREDRRRFLGQLSATLAGGAAMAMFPQFDLVSRALAATTAPASGHRALVCIFLLGGNDSFNMLMPHVQSEYDVYLASRGGVYDPANNSQGLGIARDQLLQINDTAGKAWGLHPSCGGLKTLFDAGELAFLANVGTLVQPVGKSEIIARTARLPPSLYSHNDQQRLWMRGHSESRNAGFGWGGMCADILRNPPSTSLPGLSPSITVAGTNLFQAGMQTSPYGMDSGGPQLLRRFSGTSQQDVIRQQALEAILQRDYPPVMQSYHGMVGEGSMSIGGALVKALDPVNGGDIATVFPADNRLAAQLRMIARTIKASRSSAINHHRQVYFASMGGFDTHDNQMAANGHPRLLSQLAEAMLAFRQALAEIGALNDTVSFTMSDFGRTLNSNGNGTDHAWGGVQMVMGGANATGGPLRGQQVWGQYPVLELDGDQAIQRGRLIPTTSNNQMGATLAKWLGVDAGDLPTIFPGIGNFASPTLGFLG